MLLDELAVPIVLAPMAGGPSTPALAAAVSEAGGLGFLASGYLTTEEAAGQIEATRELTARPLGVNVFVPPTTPAEPATYRAYIDRLTGWAETKRLPLGEPHFDDDGFAAKIAVLADAAVPVVSFTFGCPPADVVTRLHAAGSEVWVTVTSPAEAAAAVSAGAEALVVQGGEAGGHRASFTDREGLPVYGLLSLLQLIRAEHGLSLVATGGIATASGVAAALSAGASAVQVGSAFLLCPEAGTSAAHREALLAGGETALTRAFTGRLARAIRNEFMDQHGAAAPIAYPEIHHVTAPLRRVAREAGDRSAINLWAGEAYALAREMPASEVVRALAPA